jgi:DNA-binding cell septation regulator SpoVG
MNIKGMRTATGCGKTVAFFSIEWPGKMTINECKLIEGKNGLFAGMPQKEFTLDGQKKYKNIVYVEKDLQNKITAAAVEEYRRLGGAAPAEEPDYSDIPF